MIKSITVKNKYDESIFMELVDPDTTGFAITSVDGLGPVKAAINTVDYSSMDGGAYNSSRTGTRNIVMNLTFMDKSLSIEEVRQKSYKYFPTKTKVELLVESDKRNLTIEGYVESNEPTIFSKSEGTTISIICPYPYFQSTILKETTLGEAEPKFHFEFANESVSEPTIVFGEYPDISGVMYLGDVKTGMYMHIVMRGYSDHNIVIFNELESESMTINVDKLGHCGIDPRYFARNDEINICTIDGKKSAKLIRNLVEYDIMRAINLDSDWIQLYPGMNEMGITNPESEYIETTIGYHTLYEGV